MKEIINIIKSDFRREGITKRDIVVYGIIVPAALLAACLLAEFINSL